METLVPYFIWAVLILIAGGVLLIAIFGVRGLAYGKAEPTTIGILLVPAVIFVLLGFIAGSWTWAAILTALIMMALPFITLFFFGARGSVRGLFS